MMHPVDSSQIGLILGSLDAERTAITAGVSRARLIRSSVPVDGVAALADGSPLDHDGALKTPY